MGIFHCYVGLPLGNQGTPKPGAFVHSETSAHIPMTDPWDKRYIYLHDWLIFMMIE